MPLLADNQAEFQPFFRDFLETVKQNRELEPEKDSEAIAAFLITFQSGLNVIF
jgi:hypothetical protein